MICPFCESDDLVTGSHEDAKVCRYCGAGFEITAYPEGDEEEFDPDDIDHGIDMDDYVDEGEKG